MSNNSFMYQHSSGILALIGPLYLHHEGNAHRRANHFFPGDKESRSFQGKKTFNFSRLPQYYNKTVKKSAKIPSRKKTQSSNGFALCTLVKKSLVYILYVRERADKIIAWYAQLAVNRKVMPKWILRLGCDSEIAGGGFTSYKKKKVSGPWKTKKNIGGLKTESPSLLVLSWQKLWVKALKMAFGSGHKISACSHERSFMTVSLFQIW